MISDCFSRFKMSWKLFDFIWPMSLYLSRVCLVYVLAIFKTLFDVVNAELSHGFHETSKLLEGWIKLAMTGE